MQFTKLTFKQWAEEFKPIQNHLVTTHDTNEFETYDIERDYVHSVLRENPRRVWTLIDTPEGEVIVNGCCIVNRLNYFVTEKAGDENTEYEIE